MVSSPLLSTDTDKFEFYPNTVFLELPQFGMYHDNFFEYVREKISDDPNTLNIISDNKKVLVQLTTSYYHFIHDQLGSILYYNQEHPEYEIIVDIAHALPYMHPENTMYDTVFEMLDMSKIKYTKIDSSKINGINLNNFLFIHTNLMSKDMPRRLHEFFARFVDDPTIVPFRNVYLSRTGVDFGRDYSDSFDQSRGYPKILQNDYRVDDNEKLDEFFESYGFDVVVPETGFKTFREQINYMYSVKTMVSISGSGLTNSIFMQPGQTVVEITSPMITTNPPRYTNTGLEEYNADIHHYFSPLSFKRKHVHISIANRTKKTSDVISTMLASPIVKYILESVKNDSKRKFWRRKN